MPSLLFVQPHEPFIGAVDERIALDASFGAVAENKDVDALKGFRALAEKGNALAQCAMGTFCKCDSWIDGLPNDVKQPSNYPKYLLDFPDDEDGSWLWAAQWFRLAAEQGNPIGQRELGIMYITRHEELD